MEQTIKFYFPDNCPLCEGKITFNEAKYQYICLGCGGYVSAHRKDSLHAKKYQPQGFLANKEINLLRKKVIEEMAPLYQERVKVQAKHELIETSLINVLNRNYYVQVDIGENEYIFGLVISQTKQTELKIKLIDQNKVISVDPSETISVTNRDKTKIWLAEKLGIKVSECQIKRFKMKQLERSLEILSEGLSEARKTAVDTS